EGRTCRQELERVVVEAREAVTEPGCLAIGDDRVDELFTCETAMEDRVAPDFGRERDGYEIGLRSVGRGGEQFGPRRLAQRLNERGQGRNTEVGALVTWPRLCYLELC